jgi:two-component system nitrate/nitrite response regulator NarP
MITDSKSDCDISQLSQLGVSCIIGMRKEPQAYMACLGTVLSGGTCCAPDQTWHSLPPGIKELSRRELQIAKLVSEGKRNQEIADVTSIGVGTVKVHISRIFKKLKVTSRVDLTLMIQKHF